jgi:hypothetical protein
MERPSRNGDGAGSSLLRGLGLGLNNGSGNPTDKFETPERANARTWLNFAGTEASRSCEMKPSNCRTPGSY